MAGHSAAVVNAGEHPAQSPAQTSFHPQSFPTNFQIPASAHSLMTAAMQDNSALFPFDEENQGFAQQSFATDNHGISSEQSIQEGQGEQAFRDLHLDLYFQQASGGEVFPDHFFTAQLPFHPRHPNHQDTSRLRSSSMSRTNSLSNGADHFASVAPTPVTPPTDHFPRMSHGLDSFYGAVYPTPQAHSQPSYPQALETEASSETDSESAPYAQLIYRALVSSKQHRLVLQDIYKWFEHNTDKTRDPKNRGWQNSIRHNLSMNGAFHKVEQYPPPDDGKKGFIWVLDPDAVRRGGVESTTRYRKPHGDRKKADEGLRTKYRGGATGGKAKRVRSLRKSSTKKTRSDNGHTEEVLTPGSSNLKLEPTWESMPQSYEGMVYSHANITPPSNVTPVTDAFCLPHTSAYLPPTPNSATPSPTSAPPNFNQFGSLAIGAQLDGHGFGESPFGFGYHGLGGFGSYGRHNSNSGGTTGPQDFVHEQSGVAIGRHTFGHGHSEGLTGLSAFDHGQHGGSVGRDGLNDGLDNHQATDEHPY